MRVLEKISTNLRWALIPLAGALAACGGSGSNSGNVGGDTGGATTSVTGSVFAAAVDGASCAVNDLSGDVVAGPFTTGSNGGYGVTLPNDRLGEDLVVECSGGTFTDEATGDSGVTAGSMALNYQRH